MLLSSRDFQFQTHQAFDSLDYPMSLVPSRKMCRNWKRHSCIYAFCSLRKS